MKLWPRDYSLTELNRLNDGNLLGHLGIEFVAIASDSLTACMPVAPRTTQPFGLLHGGASVALAESVGSFASFLALRDPTKTTIGLEVNVNHLRPVTSGFVYGVARLTVAVVPRPKKDTTSTNSVS